MFDFFHKFGCWIARSILGLIKVVASVSAVVGFGLSAALAWMLTDAAHAGLMGRGYGIMATDIIGFVLFFMFLGLGALICMGGAGTVLIWADEEAKKYPDTIDSTGRLK